MDIPAKLLKRIDKLTLRELDTLSVFLSRTIIERRKKVLIDDAFERMEGKDILTQIEILKLAFKQNYRDCIDSPRVQKFINVNAKLISLLASMGEWKKESDRQIWEFPPTIKLHTKPEDVVGYPKPKRKGKK